MQEFRCTTDGSYWVEVCILMSALFLFLFIFDSSKINISDKNNITLWKWWNIGLIILFLQISRQVTSGMQQVACKMSLKSCCVFIMSVYWNINLKCWFYLVMLYWNQHLSDVLKIFDVHLPAHKWIANILFSNWLISCTRDSYGVCHDCRMFSDFFRL